MSISEGYRFLRQRMKERPAQEFTRQLYLYNDRIPEFWFLHEGAYVVMMHGVEKVSRTGKPWRADVICARETHQDPVEHCPLCVRRRNNDSRVSGPWDRAIVLVYVEKIYHLTEQSADYARRAGATVVARKRAGAGTVWEEEVNDIRLLIMRQRLFEQADDIQEGRVPAALLDDGPMPTLLGQPYHIRRSGERTAVTEQLIPRPPREIPEIVLKLRQTAEGDVVRLARQSFGQEDISATTVASGSGRSSSVADALSDDDDDLLPLDGWASKPLGNTDASMTDWDSFLGR